MVLPHFKNEPERIPEVLNMKVKGKHPKGRPRSRWGKKIYGWKKMHRIK